MQYPISCITLDTSIQARANINTELVTDYADSMTDGTEFPPVILFGTDAEAHPGDGWHRILAAKQAGLVTIAADLRPGGRMDALRYALGANATHGQRRTNADKRRAVEIALREFPGLSSRAIAEMCGVSAGLVDIARKDQLPNLGTSLVVTGTDGKQYPATRKEATPKQEERQHKDEQESEKQVGKRKEEGKAEEGKKRPPSDGMVYAESAIYQLKQIAKNDLKRKEAFEHVAAWMMKHGKGLEVTA